MGLGLGKGTLRDATLEVLAEEDTLVGEDAAGGEGRLGADVQPLEGLVTVEDDGGRVGVRVVRAELLDEPSCSMKRPSRGERESATTMWKNAKFFLPWRWSLFLTAIVNLF